MSRDKKIRFSEREKQRLRAQKAEDGLEDTPFAAYVMLLLEGHSGDLDEF